MSGELDQQLTRRQRRRAFCAATVIVVGVVALIGILGRATRLHGPAPGRARASIAAAPMIADVRPPDSPEAVRPPETRLARAGRGGATRSPAASTDGAERRNPRAHTAVLTVSLPARRVILAHAREFLGAYLQYEVGANPVQIRETIARAAMPPLAQQLLQHPLRLPAGERPVAGTVKSVDIADNQDAPLVIAEATIARAGWLSSLAMYFDRASGRWLVSGVR